MSDENQSGGVAQGAGKPYGWAVERPGDNTFPRLYRTKAEADAMVEYVNVNPPATARPLFDSQPPAAPVSVCSEHQQPVEGCQACGKPVSPCSAETEGAK